MRNPQKRYLSIAPFALWALLSTQPARGIGIVSHMEIAERARQVYVLDDTAPYREILTRHADAFRAGAIFPDWGFAASMLEKGEPKKSVADAAEAAHWTLFYEMASAYLRERPKPWDQATEKLAAFLLGALGHAVTDLYWHDQACAGERLGLLQAMANDDFSKDYQFLNLGTKPPPPPIPAFTAHAIGDAGSDVLSWYEVDLRWIPVTLDVPVDALLEIYRRWDLHRPPDLPAVKVTREQLVKGMLAEFAYCQVFRSVEGTPLGTFLANHDFPFIAGRSRFLVEQFASYPVGGADQTAVLTSYSWPTLMAWFDHAPAAPPPVTFLHCPRGLAVSGSAVPRAHATDQPAVAAEIVAATRHLASQVQVRGEPGGILLEGPDGAAAPAAPTPNRWAYASLGTSVASTRDLVVAGAPGYSPPGKPRAGAVVIRKGGAGNGQVALPPAALLRTGPAAYGRFGQAVALVDLNADGKLDLVVSAPDVGAGTLTDRGTILVFFGTDSGFSAEPDLVIRPDADQVRFGWVLASADCNGDGIPDLIVGSPFAPGRRGGRQGGQVAIYLASPDNVRGSHPRPAWTAHGERANDAFGSAIAAAVGDGGEPILAVGAPGVKDGGRQGVGRIYGYRLRWKGRDEPVPSFTVTGSRPFARLGSALALGDPTRQGRPLLAAASPTDDRGDERQAGNVVLLPVAALAIGQHLDAVRPVARFLGNQRFARFGWRLDFADVDGDGVVDLLVSEPLRRTGSGRAAGAAYVWFGGAGFPTGEVDAASAPWKTFSAESQAGLGSALAAGPGMVILGAERSSRDARLGGGVLVLPPRRSRARPAAVAAGPRPGAAVNHRARRTY